MEVSLFNDIKLKPDLRKVLKKYGFIRTTWMQNIGIPLGISGVDLLLISGDVEEKRIMYQIIVLDRCTREIKGPQALIVLSNRQAALKVASFLKFLAVGPEGTIACVLEMPSEIDRKELANAKILIGTPGRIVHMINVGSINTKSIEIFILDDFEKLMDSRNFRHTIQRIRKSLNEKCQIIACGLNDEGSAKISRSLTQPIILSSVEKSCYLLNIRQIVLILPEKSSVKSQSKVKFEGVLTVLNNLPFNQCVLYGNTERLVEACSRFLTKHKYRCSLLKQTECEEEKFKILDDFYLSYFRTLCTDEVSLSIRSDKINLVINLDVPDDFQTYLKRVSTVGDFESKGIGITILATANDHRMFSRFLKETGNTMNVFKFPTKNTECPLDLWDFEKQPTPYLQKESGVDALTEDSELRTRLLDKDEGFQEPKSNFKDKRRSVDFNEDSTDGKELLLGACSTDHSTISQNDKRKKIESNVYWLSSLDEIGFDSNNTPAISDSNNAPFSSTPKEKVETEQSMDSSNGAKPDQQELQKKESSPMAVKPIRQDSSLDSLQQAFEAFHLTKVDPGSEKLEKINNDGHQTTQGTICGSEAVKILCSWDDVKDVPAVEAVLHATQQTIPAAQLLDPVVPPENFTSSVALSLPAPESLYPETGWKKNIAKLLSNTFSLDGVAAARLATPANQSVVPAIRLKEPAVRSILPSVESMVPEVQSVESKAQSLKPVSSASQSVVTEDRLAVLARPPVTKTAPLNSTSSIVSPLTVHTPLYPAVSRENDILKIRFNTDKVKDVGAARTEVLAGRFESPAVQSVVTAAESVVSVARSLVPSAQSVVSVAQSVVPSAQSVVSVAQFTVPAAQFAVPQSPTSAAECKAPTAHFTLPEAQYTVSSKKCTVHAAHLTVPAKKCTVHAAHFTVPAKQCTASAAHFTVPVAESAALAVRSGEPGARKAPPAVRSGVRSEETAVRSEDTTVRSAETIDRSGVAAVRAGVSTVQSGVSAAQSAVPAAQPAVPAAKSAVSAAKSAVFAAKSAVFAAKSAVPIARSAVLAAQSGVSTVQPRVSATKSEISEAKSEISAAQLGVSTARARVSATKSEVSAAQSEVSAAQSGVSPSRTRESTTKPEIPAAPSGVSPARARKSAAKSEISAAQSGVSPARARVSAAQSGVSAAQSGVSAAQSGVSVAKSGVSAAQSGVSAAQSGVASPRSGVASTRLGVASARAGVASARAEGVSARTGVASAKTVASAARSKLPAAQQAVSPARSKLPVAQQAVSPARHTVSPPRQTVSQPRQTVSPPRQTVSPPRQTVSPPRQTVSAAPQTVSAARQTSPARQPEFVLRSPISLVPSKFPPSTPQLSPSPSPLPPSPSSLPPLPPFTPSPPSTPSTPSLLSKPSTPTSPDH